MRRFFGHFLAAPWFSLGVFEGSLTALGGCLALNWLLSTSVDANSRETIMAAGTLSLGIVLLMYSGGLYDRDAVLDLRRVIWRLALVAAPIAGLAIFATDALAKSLDAPTYPYRFAVMLTGLWLISAVSLRLLFREFHKAGYLTRRVLFVGSSRQAAELSDLTHLAENGFRVVEQIDPSLGGPPDLLDIAARARHAQASEIVVSIENSNPFLWEALFRCRFSGLRVTQFLDFVERESKQLCIDHLREDWIALSDGFHFGGSGAFVRRVADVILAILILLGSAPVMLLTALAIRLDDGGPVFYRQERVGLHGRHFVVLKFRSMRPDAERDGIPAWAKEQDYRITAVGKIIRKMRIDELPQFLNVLNGTMAIIGPRPERPYFVEQFSQTIPFYDYRHAVKPGITGWAQVSFRYGASLEDSRRKLSYDLYYIKNRNFWFDIVILLKTIGVVVRGDGAR